MLSKSVFEYKVLASKNTHRRANREAFSSSSAAHFASLSICRNDAMLQFMHEWKVMVSS